MIINLPNRFVILLIMLIVSCNCLLSQDTVKIMTYNLLNYSGSTLKDQNFRKTIKYSNPDILVVEEILSEVAMNRMLNEIMNYYTPNVYSAGTFTNGFDTDNSIFYKHSKFTFISNTPIQTDLRLINLYTLVHNLSGDTVRLFAVHLKASSGASNEQQRLVEVNYMRNVTNAFAPGTEFMVLGDFNIYYYNEPAYLRMIQVEASNEGQFVDPYYLPGTWNQSGYAPYHSQSTRTNSLNDSGATGGLDDRFDMILNSKAVTESGRIKYISDSLKPFGNDGNHYNSSINQQPNTAVPDSIANALYYGSDHLPVYALYLFGSDPSSVGNVSEVIPEDFVLHQNFPNPFNPETVIRFDIPKSAGNDLYTMKVFNSSGKEVRTLFSEKLATGKYEVTFTADELSSGVYFYKLLSAKHSISKSMILIK